MAKARLLIVEDVRAVGMLVATALRHYGFECVGVAQTRAEALQLTQGCKPDLALVEAHLRREGRGQEAGLRLARFLTWGEGVPCLFITAAASLVRPGREGCGVLMKPFSMQSLGNAVEFALEMLRTGRAPRELPPELRLWPPVGGPFRPT